MSLLNSWYRSKTFIKPSACRHRMLWRDRLVQPIFACHLASTYHIYARTKAKAGDLPFCLNIYLFSYLVFARSVNSRLPRRMRRFVQMFAARRCGKHSLSAKYEYKTQTIKRCDTNVAYPGYQALRYAWVRARFYRFFILPWADPEGGHGSGSPPLEDHKLYWFT